jgi:hypothetical protein
VGVFEYHVNQQHSPLVLTLGSIERAIAFEGLIYVDQATATVWRITNAADQFPPELRTKSISRSVDYGEVAIGPNHYILPLEASVLLDTGESKLRNELHFDHYRKFAAESSITFSPAELRNNAPSEPIKR